MKKIILALLALAVTPALFAQKGSKSKTAKEEVVIVPKKYTCDSIVVDFETGLLNSKIGPNSPLDSIKKYLPCITMEIPSGSEDRACGGGSVLEKQGIFFNHEHVFVEFSSTTLVHLSLQVIGVNEDDLATITGFPTQVMDLQPYTDRPIQSVHLFPKSYGCLAIWVDQKDKKVFKVQLHNTDATKAFLCVE